MFDSDLIGKIVTGLLTALVTLSVCLINNAVQLKRDRNAREQAQNTQINELRQEMARQISEIRADFMAHMEELIATQQDITNKMQLFSYQLDELSSRVEKHNNVIERTYALEKKMEVTDERYEMTNKRLISLEGKEK